ncbi:MAG: 2-amino-4-hydroxy-6-hydroxymethyldihydropteridine diphosphokinase [Gemmataceae bacterium]|nr:2-amino-4-hydroxy-6-hydroxymethyldihydropteridine diphosphokinase [Gemmataceae bacterium]
MPTTVHLALGSNMGDRRAHLDRALQLLRDAGLTIHKVSSYRETDPVGGPPGQGKYLNAAASAATSLEPLALLALLMETEQRLGRVRAVKHGPRTMDLDLLLVGDRVIAERDAPLLAPHPRLQDRLFVLESLAEIAADVVHPVFQRTMAELLADLRQRLRRQPVPGRELAGLRALVTGSTSGIGRAIALELATAGADVLVHGRRLPSRADEVTAMCRSHGGRSEAILGDLRDESVCLDIAAQAWRAWNGLDIFIANAGADTLTGDAGRWPFARKLAELWSVDVAATVTMCRDLGQRMHDRGTGAIITMGWDQAETGMEGDSGQLFAAAKGAVMGFTRSLALTLAPEVRVNCLAPGWIKTAWGERASTRWHERVRRETPLERWGTPQDVAAAARWLAAPASSYVTGQIIRVNGGAVRG